MKVVSIATTRVGFLKPIDEILPIESAYPPDIAGAIADRYSFRYAPDFSQPWSSFEDKGLEFSVGQFELNGSPRHIERLQVFGGGLLVTTPGTEVGEAFLEDLLAWGRETHGFRVPDSIGSFLAFLSQLIVEFDASMDRAISRFATLSAACAESFENTYGMKVDISGYGFSLNYDRTSIASRYSSLSPFAIERRVGEPFSANRLFCQAPLRTDDHIRLLELIESTLIGGS